MQPEPPHPEMLLRSDALGVRHGFCTRLGGVSPAPFDSLNCGLKSSDSRANIVENRARVANAMGIAGTHLLGLSQVHSADVALHRRGATPWAFGQGPQADALVSDDPAVALGVITADCGPVLFADPEAGVVGAAHAGWRGAVGGVLEATVSAMQALGARNITAVVGPCIAQTSYEVGADMRTSVLEADARGAAYFIDGARADHWQFDLAGYCVARLIRAGIKASALHVDTLSDPRCFFSHRRRTLAGGGEIGHQISVIRLAPDSFA